MVLKAAVRSRMRTTMGGPESAERKRSLVTPRRAVSMLSLERKVKRIGSNKAMEVSLDVSEERQHAPGKRRLKWAGSWSSRV